MNNIRINNLTHTYYIDNREINVIKNLNLELTNGEITVVLGKSGCGKTTLLRLIQGIEEPTSGTIIKENLKLSIIFQEPRLMPWLNVFENVTFHKLKKSEIDRDEVYSLLKLVNLDNFINAYPLQLSGGMQSRVSLIRSLLYKPDCLLLDEPFAALDYFTRERLQDELIKLKNISGVTMLFVTHSIDEAIRIADKIYVMNNGTFKNTYKLDMSQKDIFSEKYIELKRSILMDLKEEE